MRKIARLSRRELLASSIPAGAVWAAQPPSPRLSTSSLLYPRLPVTQACERIAALGFEAVDIWATFQDCRHLEEVAERHGAAGLRKMLAGLGLSVSTFSVYRPGYAPFAKLIGDFGGGVAVRGSTNEPGDGSLTAQMRRFLESLKPEIELAGQHNTRLAIENHSGKALLNHIDSIKAFVDLNQSPRVGIALAPYHVQRNRESVEEAIAAAGSQLLFFYAWQHGKTLDQLPGHGPTDFQPWIAALNKAGYAGYLNVFMHHDVPPAEMDAALATSAAYLAPKKV
ncbi:MAG: TIM barrel protein [bacterium]|nr:TIM barrel protein [bacterium]